MANEWNTAYPIDHTKIGDVPGKIRKLKTSAKTQIDREHAIPVDGDATGGEHSNGSAVAYVGAATPTNRPDGATALSDTDVDDGRLWLDDTASPATLKRFKDSAFEAVKTLGGFTPAAYADEESVTLPNGFIIKHGVAAYSGSDLTITFGTAFPTACNAVNLTIQKAAWGNTYAPLLIGAPIAASFVASSGNATSISIHWIAVGY